MIETYLLIRHTSSSSQCLCLLSVLLMVAIPEDVQGADLLSALKESIALFDYYTHTPHVTSGSAIPLLLCRRACLIGWEVIKEYLHHNIWRRSYVWWHLRNHVWCHTKDSWLVISLECDVSYTVHKQVCGMVFQQAYPQHIYMYKQGTEGLSVKRLKVVIKNGTAQVAGRRWCLAVDYTNQLLRAVTLGSLSILPFTPRSSSLFCCQWKDCRYHIPRQYVVTFSALVIGWSSEFRCHIFT